MHAAHAQRERAHAWALVLGARHAPCEFCRDRPSATRRGCGSPTKVQKEIEILYTAARCIRNKCVNNWNFRDGNGQTSCIMDAYLCAHTYKATIAEPTCDAYCTTLRGT